MGKGKNQRSARATSDVRDARRDEVREGLLGFACTVAVAFLGVGAFAMPHNSYFSALGPLAGVIAALASRRWWVAGPAAGAGVLLGTLLGAAYSTLGVNRFWFPASYWVVAGIAVAVGAGGAYLRERRPSSTRWLEWAGVVCVLGMVWVAGLTYATQPIEMGFAPIELFRSTPAISADSYDEQLFVLTVRRMQQGSGYYAAMGRTLADVNAARPGVSDDLSRPTSFRLPTLYEFLAVLPNDGRSWSIAMLVLVSAGVVAAWSIAVRYTVSSVALVGMTLSGVFMSRFAGINLPDSELWAGVLGLIAVALALKSLSVKRRAVLWATAAAAVALLATLTRELAVAFLLVGIASSVALPRVRSARVWVPWISALAGAMVAYLLHAQQVIAVARTLPSSGQVAGFLYFDPTGRGLVAGIAMLARDSWWMAPVAWVVWACGTVGGVLAPRDWPRRVLLGSVTVGGALAIFSLHPWTPPGYPVTGLWSAVVMPSVVACTMLVLARAPGAGRPSKR